jgi:hypothetical protein
MTTQPGMLAQTIHEDRLRDYAHPAWRHAAELRSASRPATTTRGILGRLIGRIRVPLAGEPALTTGRP